MENPYVGPKPFEREDEYRFYGRTQESEQLVATIMGSPVTLLYAESGAGKTSLLRAKVILMLERLDDEDSGEESKRDVLRPARVSGGAKVGDGSWNIFTANVLNSIASKEELEGRTLTLTEYLRERPRMQIAEPGKAVKTPPIKPLRVLIIDQFEELFTSGAEWWQHRQPFVHDLATALDEDRRLRVVIAMREEYVANMDPYSAVLPGALRTRVRLQRLREKSALDAITGPLKNTSVSFASGAAEKLVRKLRTLPGSSDQQELLGEFVEPLHLQVVCSRIWQSLPDGEQEITEAMIGAHGDIEEALTEYYDQCIREVSEEARIGEPSLRGWFERELITENKTRGIVFCGRDFVGSLRTPVVELIAKRYLIRAEFRGGGKWYELSHDRMIGPVLESGRRWRESQTTGKIVKRLEDAARQWSLTGGRGTLTDEELAELDAWLRSSEGRDYVMTKELKELVQASRLTAQQRQTRRIRLYLITAVLAGIAGLLVIGGFWYFTRKAQHDSMVATLVQVAERQYRKGDHFEALLWSLKALRGVGNGNVPSALRNVTVGASTKIGSETWLRTKAPIEDYVASAKGHIVVTNSKDEICIWDLRVPGKFHCATPPPTGDVGFRPSFVSDDGSIVVLRVARLFFEASLRDRPSAIVLDATLKRTILSTSGTLLVSDKNPLFIVLKNGNQTGTQLTSYDATGRKLHEAVNVPPVGNRAISPSGGLAVFETFKDIIAVDLRREPPATHVVTERGNEDVDSFGFSEDESRLIIAREPTYSTSVSRLQVFDTATWKETRITPPASLDLDLFMVNRDATQFVFLSTGRPLAASSRSIVGVIKNVNDDGVTSAAKFSGMPVSFDSRGLLLSLNTAGESQYVWWQPFVDWRHYKKIRLNADAKAVSILGAGRGLAAIQNGAVRLLWFDAKPEAVLAANASAGAMIDRACRQLKWQPEHDLVKDICTGE